MAFKLKLNEQGNAVLQDGKPVFVSDEGKEVALDANEVWNKYHSLGEEAKSWREKFQKANETAKAFEGYDIETVKKNAEIAAKFNEHEAVKNGEIEKLKQEIVSTSKKKLEETKRMYEAQLTGLSEEKAKLENRLTQNILSNHFLNSPYIKENLIVPADMVKALFGANFRINSETGKPEALGEDGRPLQSEKKLGHIADFDEAIELMIKNYPNKDSILRPKHISGGGMNLGGRGAMITFEQRMMSDPKTKPEQKLAMIRSRRNSGN